MKNKILTKLPKHINSSIEDLDEEIWEYTRGLTEQYDSDGLSKKDKAALKQFVLILLNRVIKKTIKKI